MIRFNRTKRRWEHQRLANGTSIFFVGPFVFILFA